MAEKFIRHEKYAEGGDYTNDIGVVKLKKKFDTSGIYCYNAFYCLEIYTLF